MLSKVRPHHVSQNEIQSLPSPKPRLDTWTPSVSRAQPSPVSSAPTASFWGSWINGWVHSVVRLVRQWLYPLKSHPLTDLEEYLSDSEDDSSIADEPLKECLSDSDDAASIAAEPIPVAPSPTGLAFVHDRDIEASVEDIAALILEPSSGRKWIDRCKHSSLIERTPEGMILYHRYNAFGLKARDSVTAATCRRLSPTTLCIELRNTTHPSMPPRRDAVRIPVMYGAFILREDAPGLTHINYQLTVELGGMFRGPLRRLVRLLQKSVPRGTLGRIARLTE